ncbi:MAG: 50S ribosomal protein L24 [Verrucomicrobia bacterium]|nr:50S ribosomal protein L24 [Verrucomicrobiota bacterium]
MPSKLHVKRDDEVVVITGKDKGKRGKIISVVTKSDRVYVEGVNIQKKHLRKSQQHPNGTILEREGAIHVSNVMLVTKFEARAAKRNTTAKPAES